MNSVLYFGGCLLLTPLVCGTLQREDYIIRSEHLPDVRFRPVIGNGHIATNVLSDTVYMNGLYNGNESRSSRARIQNYVAVDVTKDNDVSRTFELDMYHGTFYQYIHKADVNLTLTYIAYRKMTRVLVTSLHVQRNQGVTKEITIPLTVNTGDKSVDFVDTAAEMQKENVPYWANVSYYSAEVASMEIPGTKKSELHVYYSHVPSVITLPAGKSEMTMRFVASMSQDKMDAKKSYQAIAEPPDVMDTHRQAWEAVWEEGRVDIEGARELSQNVASATYNILCSVPDQDDTVTPFFGLSPGGLSRGGLLVPSRPGGGHNDYAGHVFWDMDTWIMPGIMMLHPGMARRMIGARTRVLDQVKQNALEAGFKGVKYPWEQAATGIEATPLWAGQMSRYEIHITADIAYGLRQYLYATGDVTILSDASRGFELAMESARFWQSRVTFTKNPERAEILGVMGPDEYHFNISNSVFTNYNAKLNLLLPQYIVDNFDVQINDSVRAELLKFQHTANLMLILFDEKLQYHPQYEDFNRTLQIKQSDVILLGYPLMMPMSKRIRQNDLEIYEGITNPEGPDTGTWSMHTVGWLELGNETRAYKNFKMMFRNINEPFKTFSEKPVTNTSTGGCVNFITAAGGLLQSVIFGYGGLRLHDDRLTINPHPLPDATSWTMKGVHYRGVVFDVITNQHNVTITPTRVSGGKYVYLMIGTSRRTMQTGDDIRFKNQEVNLHVANVMTTTTSKVIVTSSPHGKSPTTGSPASTTKHSGVSESKACVITYCSILLAMFLLFI